MSDYTPYQERVIKRYYEHRDQLAEQRLAELVSEIFLAKGKKLERLWQNAAAALAKAGVPLSRIEHILAVRDPALVASVVKELQSKPH
jgi:ATP/maltotriose-dependent transcriptional regulator MalT